MRTMELNRMMNRRNKIFKALNKGAVAMLAAAFALTLGLLAPYSPPCHGEPLHRVDRHFVDSVDYTGYYVDVNTIQKEGNLVMADVYMVKALYNTMYCYGVVYNLNDQSYQYGYTKIYQYDTRRLTSYSEVPSMVYGYANAAMGNNMVMAEVLRFCQEYRPGQLDTRNNTDVGEMLE